jgi:hypothetical protein
MKLSLIFACSYLNKDAETFSLSLLPLAYVMTLFLILPNPSAVFLIVNPFSFIKISISPKIFTESMNLPVLVLTFIATFVRK